MHYAKARGHKKMYDMLFERACEDLLEPSDCYDSLQMREGGIPDDLMAFYSTAPGCPMRMDSRDKKIALTNAIERGNLAVVAVMLDRGVSPDFSNEYYLPALHLAIQSKSEDIFLELLERGADPSVKNILSRSALHLVARIGNSNAVRVLLKGGADVDSHDRTALFSAHSSSVGRTETADIVKLLLRSGKLWAFTAKRPLTMLMTGHKDAEDMLLVPGIRPGDSL